jgi:hypothetical protein|tara:strand:+ start:2448 stop:2777 length:330 start_codon:yes stop_codon:yes gene_type:complete
MKKFKITNTTRTIWSQETKQTDLEIDDGTKVSIRQTEDDNGVTTFFFIDGESENWLDLNSVKADELLLYRDDLYNLIKSVGCSTFDLNGFDKIDEEVIIDKFIDDLGII